MKAKDSYDVALKQLRALLAQQRRIGRLIDRQIQRLRRLRDV